MGRCKNTHAQPHARCQSTQRRHHAPACEHPARRPWRPCAPRQSASQGQTASLRQRSRVPVLDRWKASKTTVQNQPKISSRILFLFNQVRKIKVTPRTFWRTCDGRSDITAPAMAPEATMPARGLRPLSAMLFNAHYSWNCTPGLLSKSWVHRQRATFLCSL